MLRLREDDDFMRTYKRGPPEWERQISNFYQRKDEIRMKAKKKVRRIIACFMAVAVLCGIVPENITVADAATTASVSLTSLGRKGSVSIGSKTKSGTWWKMKLNKKDAFCVNLGYTCHSGNTYAAENSYQWNQSTGGEKHGYYAKVIRWYVLIKKRSNKAFVMSQALIWSIGEGHNSETQLKDVIRKVKGNIDLAPNKSVNDIYHDIFEPSGEWEASVTFWQKTGNSKSYQKLVTVDADKEDIDYTPTSINDSTYYRQRITVKKKDEDGKGLAGIQFTLNAHNLDDLYSFSVTDRDGTEFNDSDSDNDTSFSITGYTRDSGRIAFRMTYRLATMDYYYYPDSDLEKMSADEKKKAKKFLTDIMELDEGVDFASDMTKASAEKLMNQEMKVLKNDISNTYTLTEDNTGDNEHIVMDPEYAKGVDITLTKTNSWEKNADGEWPDLLEEIASDYSKAYITGITNRYKKATVDVVKIDKYSSDRKAHGDAKLDGAQFQLYADATCTNLATVYDADGTVKNAGIYTVKNGKLVTDYLRSGCTYYLKEIKAPKGYTLSNDILPVYVDATGVTAEYTPDIATMEYGNMPILGKVAVQKYHSDGQTGALNYEAGATFQVYLTAKKSFDNCSDYERAIIKTDEKGYAITGDLYYGDYTVHQVDSGGVDVTLVDDFPVQVTENGKVYTFPMDNTIFKAYLRILKKDGNTEKQVLKPGTTYQIYRVTEDGEKLVEQTYSDGNSKKTINQFITDETGEVMTVKELKSGTYRIYETDSATGLHITEKYIEVTINSKAENYESFTDEDGNTHAIVTVTYTNKETYGKLKLYKTGEMLTGFQDGAFVYERRFLKGAVFEVYAAEDIVTQDNQGTNWFDKGSLVTTITTGEGAEFEKNCKDITGYSVDSDGAVTVQLPLGKYHIKEKKTLYGYVLPDAGWDVEFNWNNKDEEYVLNATDITDEKGVLSVDNSRVKAAVSLLKSDAAGGQAIAGAEFGFFTKDDIYNVDGEKIVKAGQQLGTVTTDEDGKAIVDMDLPLMSEEYEVLTPFAVKTATETAVTLNSGDYYFKELSVSDSYYLDDREYPVHLEYQNQDTKEIHAIVEAVNTQTSTTISKQSITNSEELAGCELQLTDTAGNVIVRWVSGDKGSIQLNEKLDCWGYRNVTANLDEKGSLRINGLFHDTTYTLTETRPADGYVTADSISFQLIRGENSQTLAAIVAGDNMVIQRDNVVRMIDDITKIEISKTDITGTKEIPGCELEITEKDTDIVIDSWISTQEKHLIEQKFVTGKTYVLTEKRPANGYVSADSIEFTVEDTGEVQSVHMKDDTTKIRFVKLAGDTGEGLRGAKYEVYDSNNEKVMSFTSKEEGYDIIGKLIVGEMYTFKEVEAPKGYQLAKPVQYTVKDSGKVQKVSATDEKQPKPSVPQTGANTPLVTAIIVLFLLFCGGFVVFRKK